MLVSRLPCPALRPFVRLLWAADPVAPAVAALPAREHVLPTGDMHLAFRLSGPGLRVFDGSADTRGRVLGHALVGGARATHYAREAGAQGRSAGAQLRPGACGPLFGAPASVFAGAHTPLDLLWGTQALDALDRLDAAASAVDRLDRLEQLLLERLLGADGPPALVAHGLVALRTGCSVRDAVARCGVSHRHFIEVFRDSTGLAPKVYARLMRFRQVLGGLACAGELSLAELAQDAGYADQAHFQRDFRATTGMTPQQWRLAAPAHPNHVRIS